MFEILTAYRVRRRSTRNCTKFRRNRPSRCRDIAIYWLFNMASVHHFGLAIYAYWKLGPLMRSICRSLSLCKIWLESMVTGVVSITQKFYYQHFTRLAWECLFMPRLRFCGLLTSPPPYFPKGEVILSPPSKTHPFTETRHMIIDDTRGCVLHSRQSKLCRRISRTKCPFCGYPGAM